MLGRRIADPEGIEGPAGQTPGLGLLDVHTVMSPDKRLSRVTGQHIASGLPPALLLPPPIPRSEGPIPSTPNTARSCSRMTIWASRKATALSTA